MDEAARNDDEAERSDEAEQRSKAQLAFYLYGACKYQEVERVKNLLALGASPDTADYWSGGETREYAWMPGLIAAFPNVEIVRLLLDAGADPNCESEERGERGVYQMSALSHALASARGNPEDPRYSEIAELLRERGGREKSIWPKSGGLP